MKNKKSLTKSIKEIQKEKQLILESIKKLDEENIDMSEVFNNNKMTTEVQRDVLDLVGELKVVPGMKELVSAFENSYLQILKSVDKNPEKILTPEQEKQMSDLIKGFASGMPFLFSMAAAVSASSDRRPELVVQNFKKSKAATLLQQAQNFAKTTPQVNLAGLEQVFSDQNLQNTVQNILNMKSDQLEDLVRGANLLGRAKQQLLDRINKYKTLIDQKATGKITKPNQVGQEAGPEIEMGQTQEMPSVPPELANILSTNFKSYMAKIQQKFGKAGLQALKQAIDSQLGTG